MALHTDQQLSSGIAASGEKIINAVGCISVNRMSSSALLCVGFYFTTECLLSSCQGCPLALELWLTCSWLCRLKRGQDTLPLPLGTVLTPEGRGRLRGPAEAGAGAGRGLHFKRGALKARHRFCPGCFLLVFTSLGFQRGLDPRVCIHFIHNSSKQCSAGRENKHGSFSEPCLGLAKTWAPRTPEPARAGATSPPRPVPSQSPHFQQHGGRVVLREPESLTPAFPVMSCPMHLLPERTEE